MTIHSTELVIATRATKVDARHLTALSEELGQLTGFVTGTLGGMIWVVMPAGLAWLLPSQASEMLELLQNRA